MSDLTNEGVVPAWMAQLPDEFKTDEAGKGYETLGDFYKDMRGRVSVPAEDATDEQKASFRTALGVPDKEDGYTLEGSGADGDEVGPWFKTQALKLGLTPKQAADFWTEFKGAGVTATAAFEAEKVKIAEEAVKTAEQKRSDEIDAVREKAEATLRADWGEAYDENKTKAKRAFGRLFGDDTSVKYFDDSGMGNDPSVIKSFARIYDSLGEDFFATGSQSVQAESEKERLDRLYPSMADREPVAEW